MEDIKANEYVRTKNKGIQKIDHINLNKTVNKYCYFMGYDDGDRCYGILKTTDIIKHSKNIIDLIEIGDYVNGYKILDIDKIENSNKIAFTIYKFNSTDFIEFWGEEDIKSIVTKEQFESIKYEV